MICVKNLSYVQRHAKALISLPDGREVNDLCEKSKLCAATCESTDKLAGWERSE